MPKQHPPKKPLNEMTSAMLEDAGKGVSTKVSDADFWNPNEDGRNTEWIDALEAIDKSRGKDSAALIKLLRSRNDPPPLVRIFIADLLERYVLKLPRGGQRTPLYDRTSADRVLLLAIGDVDRHIKNSKPEKPTVAEAVDVVAARYDIRASTLLNAKEGRRGAIARTKRRLRS